MAAVLNEPSGWRGRQQQITTLQNKVSGLPCMIRYSLQNFYLFIS